jgi:predicted house-cleaning noncanonical NTP pyrophosphatase (MazG superfamily)
MSGSRVYYNKLVRDAIPAKIASKNQSYEVRAITDPQEFQQELSKKVLEEATALAMVRTKEEFLEEYADLVMVLETLTAELAITPEEIVTARTTNLAKKGGYKEAYYLHWSEDADYKSNETPQGIPLSK